MIWYARYRHFILHVNASIVGYDLYRLHYGKYTLFLDFIFVTFRADGEIEMGYNFFGCFVYILKCYASILGLK